MPSNSLLRWRGERAATLDEIEEAQARASEQSGDLVAVVPSLWPLMLPIAVHPDFVGWFRDHFEAARVGLDESAWGD